MFCRPQIECQRILLLYIYIIINITNYKYYYEVGPADPITIFHILYHTVIIISLQFGLYVISFARYFMLGRIWNITMRLGQPTPSHPRLPRFRKRNVKYRRTIEKMESLGFVLWLFSIKVYPISLAYDRRHPAKSWVRNYIYCSQLWTLRYIDGKTISFRTLIFSIIKIMKIKTLLL